MDGPTLCKEFIAHFDGCRFACLYTRHFYSVNQKNASKVLLVMLKINFVSYGAQPTFLWHERGTCYQLSYHGVNLHATLLTNKAE